MPWPFSEKDFYNHFTNLNAYKKFEIAWEMKSTEARIQIEEKKSKKIEETNHVASSLT